MITDLPPDQCPACKGVLEAVTDVRLAGAVPKPGDLSVCIWCAAVLVFGNDLKLRLQTAEESLTMSADDRRMVNFARLFVLTRPPVAKGPTGV